MALSRRLKRLSMDHENDVMTTQFVSRARFTDRKFKTGNVILKSTNDVSTFRSL